MNKREKNTSIIIKHFKSRLSLIVRVNVVLNRTVVVDSDWRFDTTCAVGIFRGNYVAMLLVVCPEDRQGAIYKIKCCDCQASYIGETGRNLSTRLTEHKLATRNGDVNNHIAEHHLQTKHQIDWDFATCLTYSTDYYQRLTLEISFTNLEQTPLNRSQQLPASYKRLIDEIKQN